MITHSHVNLIKRCQYCYKLSSVVLCGGKESVCDLRVHGAHTWARTGPNIFAQSRLFLSACRQERVRALALAVRFNGINAHKYGVQCVCVCERERERERERELHIQLSRCLHVNNILGSVSHQTSTCLFQCHGVRGSGRRRVVRPRNNGAHVVIILMMRWGCVIGEMGGLQKSTLCPARIKGLTS